jgi:hypothetical protein
MENRADGRIGAALALSALGELMLAATCSSDGDQQLSARIGAAAWSARDTTVDVTSLTAFSWAS